MIDAEVVRHCEPEAVIENCSKTRMTAFVDARRAMLTIRGFAA